MRSGRQNTGRSRVQACASGASSCGPHGAAVRGVTAGPTPQGPHCPLPLRREGAAGRPDPGTQAVTQGQGRALRMRV